MEFVAQLGDIIDSRAKEHKGSELECEKVSADLTTMPYTQGLTGSKGAK